MVWVFGAGDGGEVGGDMLLGVVVMVMSGSRGVEHVLEGRGRYDPW